MVDWKYFSRKSTYIYLPIEYNFMDYAEVIGFVLNESDIKYIKGIETQYYIIKQKNNKTPCTN